MKLIDLPWCSMTWFLPVAFLCFVGCGGPYDASVSGEVTLDGNKLSRGTVTFNPKSSGPQAYGRINGQGKYTMLTGREEGLAPGPYTVTVVANELPAAEGRDGGPPPMGKPITPKWYRNPKTSGLEFTVEPGSQEINMELSSEPPPDWNPPKRRRR